MRLRIVTAVGLSAAGGAMADTVDMAFVGNGNGRQVMAYLGSQKLNVFAGRLNHETSGGTGSLAGLPASIVTFCCELLQNQPGSPAGYTLSSVATLSGNTGLTNLGMAKQQAIYDLYAAAEGRQFTLGLDYACAFQVAVWEVVYDYNTAPRDSAPLDVLGGNFRATAADGTPLSASIMDKVTYLLGSVGLGAPAAGIVGLRSPSFQDQLYDNGMANATILPLPPAAWIGLAGLGLAGVIRLRRRG